MLELLTNKEIKNLFICKLKNEAHNGALVSGLQNLRHVKKNKIKQLSFISKGTRSIHEK